MVWSGHGRKLNLLTLILVFFMRIGSRFRHFTSRFELTLSAYPNHVAKKFAFSAKCIVSFVVDVLHESIFLGFTYPLEIGWVMQWERKIGKTYPNWDNRAIFSKFEVFSPSKESERRGLYEMFFMALFHDHIFIGSRENKNMTRMKERYNRFHLQIPIQSNVEFDIRESRCACREFHDKCVLGLLRSQVPFR